MIEDGDKNNLLSKHEFNQEVYINYILYQFKTSAKDFDNHDNYYKFNKRNNLVEGYFSKTIFIIYY